MSSPAAPTIEDIRVAARRISAHRVATPLLESHALNERVGGRVLLKPECLQRTGSFKFRGAANFILGLSPAERRGGVVAYSSGNHAQGVAAAAQLADMAATIVMPADAPAIKLANTRALGAEVVTYDRARESREDIAGEIQRRRGAVLAPPFEHPAIIAGQGTVGLELVEAAAARGARLDAVLVPCGGGGLIAGIATALAAEAPQATVHAVEPAAFDDTRRSLAAGVRLSNHASARTICDALMAPTPGELTFAINRRLLQGGLAVDDDAVRAAVAYAFRVLKLVVEPGGAVGLAALLAGAFSAKDRIVGVVLSGGNIDAETFREILADTPR